MDVRRLMTTTIVSNLEAIFILNICICANEFDEINHSSSRRYEEVTKTKYDLISKIKSYNFFVLRQISDSIITPASETYAILFSIEDLSGY